MLVGLLGAVGLGWATLDNGDKAATAPHRYAFRPLVGSHGLYVKADGPLADSCIYPRHSPHGIPFACSGAGVLIVRPPQPRLPVEPGARVSIQFFHHQHLRDRARKVFGFLARVSRESPHRHPIATLEARRTAGHWYWRLRLPHNLEEANVLSVVTRLPRGGHARYLVGLKPVGVG